MVRRARREASATRRKSVESESNLPLRGTAPGFGDHAGIVGQISENVKLLLDRSPFLVVRRGSYSDACWFVYPRVGFRAALLLLPA